jgi:predicted metal-dependent enzyme (double-stranded beta helix superfamily)
MENQTGYIRHSLLCCRWFELVLVIWPPGSRSPAHDHGESNGLILILWGEIYQKIFQASTLKYQETQRYRCGQWFSEVPGPVHIMGNDQKESKAVSLHFYLGRLKMTKYPDQNLVYS